MSNDACDKILSFMQSQANGRINIPVRTRSIADAAGLTYTRPGLIWLRLRERAWWRK